jgi:hypothetical protein
MADAPAEQLNCFVLSDTPERRPDWFDFTLATSMILQVRRSSHSESASSEAPARTGVKPRGAGLRSLRGRELFLLSVPKGHPDIFR